ncbi:hypothetical protein KKF81_05080 [Candidatus Micrarchaeota archaeon]|nr:hypothetical protein [Candidatus Micrarchaeota archaeon]MBU1166300.1 hypothetical protein [Candidatus Micrarchaeota archaeon]MBU1886390.1 hypothetical protein [Candidatus Micrarchaeota archaeon]
MIEVYAIIGDPVSHSKSPQIHNAAFEKSGVNAVYVRLAIDSATRALNIAKEMNIKGFNITAPFKEEMCKAVDELDDSAKIGAVNTAIKKNKKWIGYNTDVHGVRMAFESNGVKLEGAKACVIGAGGAAKAAAYTLRSKGAWVTIANRTIEKAEMIAKELGCGYCRLDEVGSVIESCNIVVSCVSTGKRIVPEKSLRKEMVILDANYSEKSILVTDAEQAGCKIISGEEWLLFQGVKAFELFTGKTIHADLMRSAITNTPSKKRNISLIGFMLSGKTTISKQIVNMNRMQLFAIDNEIEKSAGMEVTEIFRTKGENEFRRIENKALMQITNIDDNVIDCGGGIILNDENIKILKQNSFIVLLWADTKTVLQRARNDKSRPLLCVEDRKARITEMLEQRFDRYMRVPDIIINTSGKTPEQIAGRILDEAH